MPPASKTRPYKDFLTPALHRRFVAALSVCLGLCYFESVFIGGKTSIFWLWFPFGVTGLRAALLFVPVMCIFLLRVSQLHFGHRTTFAGWDTFKIYAFRFQTVRTVSTYCLSAMLFSEIYIWSTPAKADLNRIKYIPRTNRTILNEKPIYFTSFFFFLAIFQAITHLYYDYDRLNNPALKFKSKALSGKEISPFGKLISQLPSLCKISVQRSAFATVVWPIIYFIDFRIHSYSVRSLAWSLNRFWAKIFWSLPKSNSLPTNWPFHWNVLMKTATSGLLLTFLWEFGNTAFSIYTVQEPLKNGHLFTSESRDPNGSLLNGLKSKRLQIKIFAFWELAYISHHFRDRRKSIFEDIDRLGGSCWSQIRDACLEEIKGISSRIDNYTSSSEPAHDILEKIPSLPRLTEPLRDGLNTSGDIFSTANAPSTPAREIARAVGNFAKSRGQSSPNRPSPKAKLLLQAAENVVLNDKQKKAMEKSGISGLMKEQAIRILRTRIGWPFRYEYRRKLVVVILGTPYGDIGVILDAIESISRLTTSSLSEDQFGNVQRDVKMIIQILTDTIIKLAAFKKNGSIHWTDVKNLRESPEVDQILVTLRRSLRRILDAFETYSCDLRLNERDLRKAREAIGTRADRHTPEMQEIS
ncbi:Nucleoporin [Podosphaera aphanis]|nr:Nucleoporin [Podosphaera aphanis]